MIGCLSTIYPLFFVEMALVPLGRPGFAKTSAVAQGYGGQGAAAGRFG
jgi:hypothetical protein